MSPLLASVPRLRRSLASFGVPRLLIVAFLLALLAVAVVRKMDLGILLTDSLVRIGRNGILVLALLPGIQGGIGLNFGLPVGILSGLVGCVLVLQIGATGWAGLLLACLLALAISVPAGWLYGRLLNRVRGQEMMVGTYTGFSLVAGMSIFWLLAPFHNPTMVWAIGGKGLRTTLPLGDSFGGILDDLGAFNIGAVRVPTGLFIVFFAACGIVSLFFRTRLGLALRAAGQNPAFARSSGIREESMRILSAVLSTSLAAVGIVIFAASYGWVQLYTAPLMMAFPAIACILIGGASINRATIPHVLFGTFLFQTILTIALPVTSSVVRGDVSEVARLIIQNGMILYALSRRG